MDQRPIISLDMDESLRTALHAAAAWRHMPVDDYIRDVLATAVRMDTDLAAFVQEGVDAADRGELISQDDMEAWFEARYRSAAAE